MSRTINEIFDSIMAEKKNFSSLNDLQPLPDNSQTFLQDLTSTSKVAIWRLMFWVFAFAIFVHEKLFDELILKVEKRAREIIPGTARWYVLEAKRFQNGDTLEFINEKFQYSDSTSITAKAKQIITQASARDINRAIVLKVAKGTGTLTPLSVSEKQSFSSYIERVKIAGTKTVIISEPPDLLKIALTIEFEPLLLKADGTLIEDGSSPVQEAIDKYINGLPFDSVFRIQDLTDSIQKAKGVISTAPDVCEAKFGNLEYINIIASKTDSYLPNAGYLITDPSPIPVYTATQAPDYQITQIYNTLDKTRFDGVVYEAKENGITGQFDINKWNTISNLTFISV